MKQIIDSIEKLKVLVIGDLILDAYIWGDARRISPEAPVPVVDMDSESFVPGGAANVALNVASLGAKVELCGYVGDDEDGRRLTGLCRDAGIDFMEGIIEAEAPTIRKTRIVVQHQQLCRLDREAAPWQYSVADEPGLSAILEAVAAADVTILADYAKGFLTNSVIAAVTETAHKAGKLVSLDPKPRASLEFSGQDLITPNRRESLLLSGVLIDRHSDFPADEVCEEIWDRYRPEHLVVTLGEEGMLLSEAGKVSDSIPTVAREVFDVSGAGDTIIAALSAAMAGGASLRDAAHFANKAAGIVIGKVGTATVSREELLADGQ